MKRISSVLLAGMVAFTVAGCQSAYYGAMEKVGVHKRDIMVDRVKEARDAQEDAKVQFKSALEEFSALVNFKGGDLKKMYDKLNRELERSEARAQDVRDRIAGVESVSGALFKEWKSELGQYSNADLRKASEQQLKRTQAQYKELIAAMKKAESKLEPVLAVLRDQVLFLKHNLNAQAVGSLRGELVKVEANVGALIQDMEAAIDEADVFIRNLSAPAGG
jgi:hypothetical protein